MAKRKTTRSEVGSRPALDPEVRENQLISMAVDVAEKQMREGTASSQIITHFLKLGSIKYQLELVKLQKEVELTDAKAKHIKSQEKIEELYNNALSAMKDYSGQGSNEDLEDIYDEEYY